ncbi:SH3 domain-containing protein [Paludibacter propionicigenes]|uniref:SH3 domain-containing protein n=1 Tax=Paludibacter propionicigenes TaxID=185300 RepID=UPI000A023E49|nr:SH3 domain-containing protein [Paludibacter propionicigenes]
MKRAILQMFLLSFTLSSLSQIRVTIADINFRSTPELTNNIICTIPRGTHLTILDGGVYIPGWVMVKYNGKLGYVRTAYLKLRLHTETRKRKQHN